MKVGQVVLTSFGSVSGALLGVQIGATTFRGPHKYGVVTYGILGGVLGAGTGFLLGLLSPL